MVEAYSVLSFSLQNDVFTEYDGERALASLDKIHLTSLPVMSRYPACPVKIFTAKSRQMSIIVSSERGTLPLAIFRIQQELATGPLAISRVSQRTLPLP